MGVWGAYYNTDSVVDRTKTGSEPFYQQVVRLTIPVLMESENYKVMPIIYFSLIISRVDLKK